MATRLVENPHVGNLIWGKSAGEMGHRSYAMKSYDLENLAVLLL